MRFCVIVASCCVLVDPHALHFFGHHLCSDCTTTPASSRGDRETSLGGLKAYQIGPVCMSFDDMKRQYLLPFKHGLKDEVDILSTYGMKHEEPAPFVNIPALSEASAEAVVHLLGRRATPRRVKCMEERIIPPEVKVDVLLQMQKAFYSSLPLAALSLRDERDRLFLYEALLDTKTIQLVQTVARYLYLQMFIKLACTGAEGLIAKHAESHLCRPPPEEIEGLYVSTTRIFAKIKQQLEREEKGIPLFLPLVLLALRVSIETIYRIQYPVSFNVTGPTMQYILMQMDASITKMLDPDEHLSRIGVLETTCESTKIMASHPFQIKKRQGRLRDQFYKTSDALHSIFPRPLPGKCRKIIKLRGGASIASYPPHLLEPQEVDDDSGRLGDVSGNNSASAGSQTATEKHNSGDTNVSVYARLQLLRIIERKGRRSI